jgi:hypothetical protein
MVVGDRGELTTEITERCRLKKGGVEDEESGELTTCMALETWTLS